MKQDRRFPIREKQHFWSASLVSLVTNLQASGSLGSCVLCSALAPWPVKKCTQWLILCVTKGQMKPQLDCSWPGRIPTSFSAAQSAQMLIKLNLVQTWNESFRSTLQHIPGLCHELFSPPPLCLEMIIHQLHHSLSNFM